MLKKSFKLLWNSFGYFLACMGLDVVFFFAIGFFTAPISFKMKELLLQITTIFATDLKNTINIDTIWSILFSRSTLVFWKSLAGYALIFILIIYILYIIFQSIAWNLSLRIIGKKIKFFKYLKTFALLNLFWFLIFIIYNILDLFSDINQALGQVSDINFLNLFTKLFLFILIYFAVISYVNLSLKKAFVLGWKKYKTILTAFLMILIYFFILNFILSKAFVTNYTLGVIIGIVLFLPALAWSRIYLALTIDKVK